LIAKFIYILKSTSPRALGMKPKEVSPMNDEKYVKKFSEVMKESFKSIGRCVGLEISSNTAYLTGLTKSKLESPSALVLIMKNGKLYCKGFFDGVDYEASSIDSLDSADSILLGIDLRSKGSNIIYYKSGTTFGRVSSETHMNPEDSMYVFWECGPNVSLTVCSYDPELDEAVIDIVSACDKPMKRLLKTLVRQLLSLIDIESETIMDSFSFDDDAEEATDHDYWNETND
jgi:hypothetical protein